MYAGSLKKHIYFYFMSVSASLHGCLCTTCVPAACASERLLGPVKLELRVVEDALWILGTKLGSSVRDTVLLAVEPSLQPQYLLFS